MVVAAASAILASSRPRRVAGSPLASSRGTQVAERQAQRRLQLIGPRQQHRPGPGQDQPRRLDRRLRLADLPAAGPDLARSSSARNSKTGRPLRYRQRLPGELLGGTGLAPLQREASQRAQVLDGEKVLAESRPPRLRISGTGGIGGVSPVAGLEPGQRPRTAQMHQLDSIRAGLLADQDVPPTIEGGVVRSRASPDIGQRKPNRPAHVQAPGCLSPRRAGAGGCPVPFSGARRLAERRRHGPARRAPAEATGCRAGSLR